MDAFTAEITLHRIGGAGDFPRSFGPWVAHVTSGANDVHRLPATGRGNLWMDVRFTRPWTLVRPNLLSTEAVLDEMHGAPVSRPRPVLLSTLPCDVPLWASFIGMHEDAGIWSLGLRLARSAWLPEDLAEVAEVAR